MGCATHPSAPPVCTGPASSCKCPAPGLPASAQSWPPLRLWMELIALLMVLFKDTTSSCSPGSYGAISAQRI
ncbi:hypothetical protein AAFF_G00361020 [Aldrovandia affinis]|uniref:Uncharacterized protein n=1 Tax=Aldrovandia affinis TaxID=143900 RepID=A0AAD7VZ80_9TELE|nr:hypothetical protein AAFF_G00361020 [Aldrovandia affinis]